MCLFYFVICDIAGYPVCLGSDRARAFTHGVVKALADIFGIQQVIGTAYHPQSQSPVERPHREFNMLCKTFMENYKDWDLIAAIFQWTIRTTTKLANASYSPYEVITGLKPRSPIDALFASPAGVEKISTEQYVRDLVHYLKEVHQHVDRQHMLIREQSQRAKYRELGPGMRLALGDYCFVRRKIEEGVSTRFQNPNFDDVFQVVETHGDGVEAKAYTLSNLKGRRDNLGFEQPVAAERLISVDILPMAQEINGDRTRVSISDRGRDRDATVKSQTLDGKVYIQYDDEEIEHCVDLSLSKYRWL